MKLRIGFKILAGYATAIVLLTIISSVAYSKARVMNKTEARVEHTLEVMNAIQDELALLKDAETEQRGYLITGEDHYLEPYNLANKELDANLEKLCNLTEDNLDQQKQWDKLASLIKDKQAELAETIELRKSGGLDAALPVVLEDRGKMIMDDIRTLLTKTYANENALLTTRRDESVVAYQTLTLAIAGGTIAGAIFLVILGLGITRSITSRTSRTLQMIQEISQGNLENSLQMKANDEIGEMARAMDHLSKSLRDITAVANEIADKNLTVEVEPRSKKDTLGLALQKMIGGLRAQIQEILDGANVIASSVSELSASSAQMASSAVEIASSINETTTTVEEVQQTTELATAKAEQMADKSNRLRETSRAGKEATKNTISDMDKIQAQMTTIAETIIHLSEQSQAIGQIISTVDSFSEQSNVLAINASIEAAKAGEQGKGFSVVAQEVKSLATQSKQATTQVRTILNEIQKATSTAVMATEKGGKVVEKGIETVRQTGQSIVTLTDSLEQSADTAAQIAATNQQQRIGMDQITSAMESVREASQQNASSAKQLEDAANNLKMLGKKLQNVAKNYQV